MTASAKKSLPAQVVVRTRKGTPPNSVMTGMNTEILINGEKFPYAKSFKFEVDAKGVAKCQIEFYGQVLIEGTIQEPDWKGKRLGKGK